MNSFTVLKIKFTKSCLTLATPWTIACQVTLWDSLGKNTGVGCHFLLQGIFLDQGSNLHLLHWQKYQNRSDQSLSHVRPFATP